MSTSLIAHFTTQSTEVAQVVTSLNPQGIRGVFYVRIYDDGNIINLASDAAWTHLYFEKLLSGQYHENEVQDQFYIDTGISLWALNPSNTIWQDGRCFGHGNGITLFRREKDYQEMIGFYAEKNNQAINHYYINHLDTVKQMRDYFVAQAAPLILSAEKARDSLHPDFSIHKIDRASSIHEPHLPVQLTPQREQCLLHLLSGKSAKEIAAIMQLAPKTIHYYTELLRKEFGCRTTRELIAQCLSYYPMR